jgi:cell wall-associated NlpC family hydrolase
MMKHNSMKRQFQSFLYLAIFAAMMTSCMSSRRLAREQKVETVVARARSYVGTPYKFGGTTALGMDCSGLLMRSFESIDIYIPRTSKEQSKMGKKVKRDELKAGDLVFFKMAKKSGKVTHAGLVTDTRRNDQILFIHSSSSRGVIEANLMTDYYQKTFTKARRLKF